MYVTLCMYFFHRLVGFSWLMIGLCARLGIVGIICSVNSFTLKYFKGYAYLIRQEEKAAPGT